MTEVRTHRGASDYAPENMLEALALAAKMGADRAKLDVQISRGDYLVVAYNERIGRISNDDGFIRNPTLEGLRGFLFNKTYPECKNARIPALRRVYKLLKDIPLKINMELKNGIYLYEGFEERILDLTNRLGMTKRVIYSSFNRNNVAFIKRMKPDVAMSALYSDGIYDPMTYTQVMGTDAPHPAFYNLQHPGVMEQAGERGLKVHVWAVNTQEQGRECLRARVDAIISNYPDKIEKLL